MPRGWHGQPATLLILEEFRYQPVRTTKHHEAKTQTHPLKQGFPHTTHTHIQRHRGTHTNRHMHTRTQRHTHTHARARARTNTNTDTDKRERERERWTRASLYHSPGRTKSPTPRRTEQKRERLPLPLAKRRVTDSEAA